MSPPSHAPGSNIEDPGLAPAGAGETNMLGVDARDAGNGPLPQFGPPTGRGKVPAIKSADVYRNGNVRIPPSPYLPFSPPFDPPSPALAPDFPEARRAARVRTRAHSRRLFWFLRFCL